ncbi:hypothetical protein Dsin_021620 [Dipteronia sinensis]|uniref:Myb/SANT-like domain-containing protein n=1 Tax=Dipteronia sinensis TaxID=43782 RepID=A0AAE0DYZ4_9ROSI|nr:hypothetical protein Dsin_021620 [Dipteronia sinensis]
MTDYSNWSIEESKMLLQLMVDAASRGWRDANGMLSKAIVESGMQPTKKFTAPEEVWEDYFKKFIQLAQAEKKRPRTDNEGNISPSDTINKAGIMEKISLSIDSIAVDFRGVHSLLEKREKDREKSEMEKREKERQSCI